MRSMILASTFFAIGVVAVGCGGDGLSNGAACTSVGSPCGGVIVPATYNIVSSCMQGDIEYGSFDSCSGMKASVSKYEITGTVTFGSDGRYSVVTSGSVAETMTIPASCMSMFGSAKTCEEYSSNMNKSLQGNPSVSGTSSCTGSSTCTCELSVQTKGSTESGTYSTYGTSLTMRKNGSSSSNSAPTSYCVSDSGRQITLYAQMSSSSPSASGGSSGSATAVIVMTRQ